MDLVTPEIGLVFWTTLSFGILFFLLAKFAWKPIMAAIDTRERSIEDALLKAEAAKDEMSRLTNENESLLKQARAERDLILAEAKKVKDQIIGEAKEAAQTEGTRMIELARVEINNQKAIAMADVKNQVAALSLEIAEKVLRKQLDNKGQQEAYIRQLADTVKMS